jgi:hypothetical protein
MSVTPEHEKIIIDYLVPKVETLLREARQCGGGADPRVDVMAMFETAGKTRNALNTRLALEPDAPFGADVFEKAVDVAFRRL